MAHTSAMGSVVTSRILHDGHALDVLEKAGSGNWEGGDLANLDTTLRRFGWKNSISLSFFFGELCMGCCAAPTSSILL